MDEWYHSLGIKFLSDIGIKAGFFILDFGCGTGSYTFPAAKLVGAQGKIYSVDKNRDKISELEKRLNKEKLSNVLTIFLEENKDLLIDDAVDAAFLFDVIHLVDNRKELYGKISGILKTNGILLVYPKHYETHMNINLNEIISEIKDTGFIYQEKIMKTLMHDNHLEQGYVLKFIKK